MTQATEQQEARKRFSFGLVWSKAVIAGTAKDHAKLIAHAVKLKIGSKSDMKRVSFPTLLAKVATALSTEEKPQKEAAAEEAAA